MRFVFLFCLIFSLPSVLSAKSLYYTFEGEFIGPSGTGLSCYDNPEVERMMSAVFGGCIFDALSLQNEFVFRVDVEADSDFQADDLYVYPDGSIEFGWDYFDAEYIAGSVFDVIRPVEGFQGHGWKFYEDGRLNNVRVDSKGVFVDGFLPWEAMQLGYQVGIWEFLGFSWMGSDFSVDAYLFSTLVNISESNPYQIPEPKGLFVFSFLLFFFFSAVRHNKFRNVETAVKRLRLSFLRFHTSLY